VRKVVATSLCVVVGADVAITYKNDYLRAVVPSRCRVVSQIKDNRAVCINATFIPRVAAPIDDNTRCYAMLREVSRDFALAPGTYCIIPTTQFRGEEADFLLRVLTPQQAELR